MMWLRTRRKDPEIAPDEIFLDSSNASFDRERFEGRLEKPLARGTFVSLAVTLGILFVVLLVRTWNLQVTNGAAFALESERNSLEVTTLFAPRGAITDVNGVILAENVQGENSVRLNAIGNAGTGAMKRAYPIPAIGQIIGYVSYPKKDTSGVYYDTKQSGIAGLELKYDALLSGKNGQSLVEKDALGRVRSEGMVIPAEAGKTLRLSVDADLEQIFASAISLTARDAGFIAGAGVILDVHTGAVRAIVSYPTYDPNVMSDGEPRETIASYNTNTGHPFLDHAVQGIYAPGSIVKPLISAGALTDGLITPNTIIDDPGSISLPDPYHPGKKFIYKGWKPLGLVDVRKAIAWSSDVFFYTVGGGFGSQKGLGIDRLDYWYRQFGLGAATGIDLPEEADGLIPTPAWKLATFKEPWYLGDTYFTAIGQYSMQVTPIQMARAISAIANGGTLPVPTLLADATPVLTIVPVSPASLAVVREGMRQCVVSALASALNFPYVSVAAKTGTAQTGTRNQYDNSWVVGFFPYDKPQYAFAVVLERGPAGAGSKAVQAMKTTFESLYLANSIYVGGTATSTTLGQ